MTPRPGTAPNAFWRATRPVLFGMTQFARRAALDRGLELSVRVQACRLYESLRVDVGAPVTIDIRTCRCGAEYIRDIRTGQARCDACRIRRCTECGGPSTGRRCRACRTNHSIAARICGCGQSKSPEARRCLVCERVWQVSAAPLHLDVVARTRRHRREASRRRRVRLGRVGSSVRISRWPELVHRDGVICWLCRLPVALDAKPNAPLAPTADHVVPLAKGGVDTLDNLRLAHRSCNSRRRDRLVGDGR